MNLGLLGTQERKDSHKDSFDKEPDQVESDPESDAGKRKTIQGTFSSKKKHDESFQTSRISVNYLNIQEKINKAMTPFKSQRSTLMSLMNSSQFHDHHAQPSTFAEPTAKTL